MSEPDYWALAVRHHCPDCGKPLRMRRSQQNHTGRTVYRVRCTDPRHWLGPWKPTEAQAYQAMHDQFTGAQP